MQIKITLENVNFPEAVKSAAAQMGLTLLVESQGVLMFNDFPKDENFDHIQSAIVFPLMAASPGCWSATEYMQ